MPRKGRGRTIYVRITARTLRSRDYKAALGRSATAEQREILRRLSRALEKAAGVQNDRKGEDDDD